MRIVGVGVRVSSAFFVLVLGAQQLPSSSAAYGAFAFSNPAGSELIVLHDVPGPGQLRSAICSGIVRPISFARLQKATGADRDVPEQFSKLTGSVFRVMNGGSNLSEDACLLAPESLLAGAQVIRTQNSSRPPACSASDQRRLQMLRERRVQTCWLLGSVQPRGSIAAVEWVREGADALASIIVDIDGRALLIDLPAKFTRAGAARSSPTPGTGPHGSVAVTRRRIQGQENADDAICPRASGRIKYCGSDAWGPDEADEALGV